MYVLCVRRPCMFYVCMCDASVCVSTSVHVLCVSRQCMLCVCDVSVWVHACDVSVCYVCVTSVYVLCVWRQYRLCAMCVTYVRMYVMCVTQCMSCVCARRQCTVLCVCAREHTSVEQVHLRLVWSYQSLLRTFWSSLDCLNYSLSRPIVCLLKAYSPANRTGSSQGFTKHAHYINIKHTSIVRKLVPSVLLS